MTRTAGLDALEEAARAAIAFAGYTNAGGLPWSELVRIGLAAISELSAKDLQSLLKTRSR